MEGAVGSLFDRLPHQTCRADRHGALRDNHRALGQVVTDHARHVEHMLQIGRPVLIGRCPDGDEDDLALQNRGADVRGEAQTLLLHVA